jgi:EAL and modified HD-GYP domain-containing signal transduction protein
MELFKDLRARYKGLFEGHFYRTPLTKGKHEVSPLQGNLISLLNMVRDENFEFDDVASIIQKDPALTVSLLRMVNSAYFALKEKVRTINQAVVMLGQTEVRKWITTAVAKLLGADKPNEITRISLIRAKFAEGLSVKLKMERDAQSLFLMGLFSVLDAILDQPIADALVRQSGPYGFVYQFLLEYETANWNAVSRMLILRDLQPADTYQAYIEALIWYNDLLGGDN